MPTVGSDGGRRAWDLAAASIDDTLKRRVAADSWCVAAATRDT